jgi:ubiquinone/menaquinone biosynthesis C-methylase UbiE
MTDALEAAKQKAERTYNAAADHYSAEPLAFWDFYGRRTVERMHLRSGARVLDVCCGAGGSALPAARSVGPEGSVLGVDLAADLLALGRAKAAASGLHNIEFRRGDMTSLGFPDRHFDAVICVFGIFQVPDMEAQVAELWRMVRPGGQLAITTWGPNFLEPGYDVWRTAIKNLRPDLDSGFNPWDRVTSPDRLTQLFENAGIDAVDAVAEAGHQPIRSAEDFWTIALGNGMRWTIEQMGPETSSIVKREVCDFLTVHHVNRLDTNVVYALARKPR